MNWSGAVHNPAAARCDHRRIDLPETSMSSSITNFIATALVLFTLGQALADPAREAAHNPRGPWGTELPELKR
jgi:hypothetical protein